MAARAAISRLARSALLFIPLLGLLTASFAGANPESGSVIPAESRPCVDCHAFEFMQRALQDLKKTAYNLDARCGEFQPRVKPDSTTYSIDPICFNGPYCKATCGSIPRGQKHFFYELRREACVTASPPSTKKDPMKWLAGIVHVHDCFAMY